MNNEDLKKADLERRPYVFMDDIEWEDDDRRDYLLNSEAD